MERGNTGGMPATMAMTDRQQRGCAKASPPHGAKRGARSKGEMFERDKSGGTPATTAMTGRPEVAPQRGRHTGPSGGKLKGSEVGERRNWGNAGFYGHDVPARGCATARPPQGAKRGARLRGVKLVGEKTGGTPATTAMTGRPEVAPWSPPHGTKRGAR